MLGILEEDQREVPSTIFVGDPTTTFGTEEAKWEGIGCAVIHSRRYVPSLDTTSILSFVRCEYRDLPQ